YPKSQDYIIITKAILRPLNIPLDNKDALMFIGRLDDEQDMFKLNQMLKAEFNKQPVDMGAITYS
ncbi:unnamed protein product, partial [Rotaria magnacalcarata]